MTDPRVALRVIRRAERSHNRYCGPAVIASLTGLDTAESARLIRRANGKKSVKGVNGFEMSRALGAAGFEVRWYNDRQAVDCISESWPKGGLTLQRWIRDTEALRHAHRALVVAVGGHWIAVAGGHYVDNHANSPRPIESYPKLRARVRFALGVGLP